MTDKPLLKIIPDTKLDIEQYLTSKRIVPIAGLGAEQGTYETSLVLMTLDMIDSKKPITLLISGPDSIPMNPEYFKMMHSMIRGLKSPVNTVAYGELGMATATLVAAGTPGRRYSMDFSLVYPLPAPAQLPKKEIEELQEGKSLGFGPPGNQETIEDKTIPMLSEETVKKQIQIRHMTESPLILTKLLGKYSNCGPQPFMEEIKKQAEADEFSVCWDAKTMKDRGIADKVISSYTEIKFNED